MVPSILGDQTAQHWHYKGGGDGIEGEAEIPARWQEKVVLKQAEVNLLLTALGESRLIRQWRSWAQPTEGQSLRTERQNKVKYARVDTLYNESTFCSLPRGSLLTTPP